MTPMRHEPPPIEDWYPPRVWASLALAFYCARFGYTYTPLVKADTRTPAALRTITAFLPGPTDHWQPVWFLGIMWVILAVLAIVSTVKVKWHNFVFIAATMFTAYWALAYLTNLLDPETRLPNGGDIGTSWFLVAIAWLISIIGWVLRPAREQLQTVMAGVRRVER